MVNNKTQFQSVKANKLYCNPYLKPVNCAAINKRWEHAQPVPESFSYRAEGQHNMKVLANAFNKFVVHVQRCELHLYVLFLAKCLHLYISYFSCKYVLSKHLEFS